MVSSVSSSVLLALVMVCSAAVFTGVVDAYVTHQRPSFTRHQDSSLYMARRGRRGGIPKEMGGKGLASPSSSSSSSSSKSGMEVNWIPLSVSSKEVLSGQPEGKVTLVDTNLPTLKNGATNPTGAVSVMQYNGQTYCFSSSCPCCKIPLTKSKVVEKGPGSSPKIVCDFCKSGYDLKTGAREADADSDSGGILGGIVKSVFSAQDSGPLPMYKLGEKGGKLLIALD